MERKHAVIGCTTALSVIVFAATLSPNYWPLLRQAHERFLESEDRAQWQIDQREAEARAAAERAAREAAERERQRRAAEAEAERQRQEAQRQAALEQQRRDEEAAQQSRAAATEAWQRQQAERARAVALEEYPQRLADYRAILRSYHDITTTLEKNIAYYEQSIEKDFRSPEGYRRFGVTIEETASTRACSHPSGLSLLFETFKETMHRLSVCTAHYATDKRDAMREPMEQHVVTLTALRAGASGYEQYLPIDHLLFAIWQVRFVSALRHNDSLKTLPALVAGETFNKDLLDDTIDSEFARYLYGAMTDEEKFRLRTTTYPDMRRLADAAEKLSEICNTLLRSPCVPDQ